MWFRFNLMLFFIVLLVQIYAKPFLKNTVQSISSASAGSPTDSGSISDYRRRKSEKIQQLAKHPNEGDDPFFQENQAVDDQGHNEALPSLLQKKISKIMRKLHFISQLINSFNQNNTPNNGNKDPDFDFDSDETDFDGDNSTVSSAIFGETSDLNAGTKEISNVDGNDQDQQRSGGLGLYFMEVLGSLFGLVYGAAIQLTGAGNSKPTL